MRFFVPSLTGLHRLETSAQMHVALGVYAEKIVQGAKAVAPVQEGDYRDGLEVITDDDGVKAAATDYKSNWIEYGTGAPEPTPAHSPMRRGVDAAGLHLRGGKG